MGHVPDPAFAVVHPHTAQRDPLDHTARLAEVDPVADAVLILGEHEEAGDHIADQRLGTERNGTTDHGCRRHEAADVDAELADDRDDGYRPDNADNRRAKNRAESSLPGDGAIRVDTRQFDRAVENPADDGTQHKSDDERHQDDSDDPQRFQQMQLVESIHPQRPRG